MLVRAVGGGGGGAAVYAASTSLRREVIIETGATAAVDPAAGPFSEWVPDQTDRGPTTFLARRCTVTLAPKTPRAPVPSTSHTKSEMSMASTPA